MFMRGIGIVTIWLKNKKKSMIRFISTNNNEDLKVVLQNEKGEQEEFIFKQDELLNILTNQFDSGWFNKFMNK